MIVQESIKQRVYIDDIDDNLDDILLAGLNYIKWDSIIKKNSKVFVKPNFTFPYYQEGITTTPKLI